MLSRVGQMAEGKEPAANEQPAAYPGYDVGRLLAFSDGVFAIAITLLVLSIPVPNLPRRPDPAQVVAALNDLVPNLIGFGLSFFLVGAQWIAHHRMLRQLTRSDNRLLWLNLLLLLGICLVPLATTLLIRYGDQPATAIAYAGLQAAIGLTFLATRAYLLGRGVVRLASLGVSLVPIAAFLISMPVALRNVNVAYGVWVAGFVVARAIEARVHPSLWSRSPS
jgi:uncharacterized membrane protein